MWENGRGEGINTMHVVSVFDIDIVFVFDVVFVIVIVFGIGCNTNDPFAL